PFVHVLPFGEMPQTRHVRGSNMTFIGVTKDRVEGRAIICSALDNLSKGASGQAVQNMNLMLGFPETLGLEQVALFPRCVDSPARAPDLRSARPSGGSTSRAAQCCKIFDRKTCALRGRIPTSALPTWLASSSCSVSFRARSIKNRQPPAGPKKQCSLESSRCARVKKTGARPQLDTMAPESETSGTVLNNNCFSIPLNC